MTNETSVGQTYLNRDEKPLLSPRLQTFMDEVLAGRAPNAGRFCGNCYAPLRKTDEVCQHCGLATAETLPVDRIPREVYGMYSLQRSREGRVVRSVAYGGLLLGIILGLMPIALWDVQTWTALALFGVVIFFYVFSANLANTVGDSLGYAWGQAALRKHWRAFIAQREAEATATESNAAGSRANGGSGG